MLNAKKITFALLIVGLLAGISLAVFFVARPSFTQPDNFVIIPAFEAQANYITAVRADPSADKDALYQKYVIDPYRESCGNGGLINTATNMAALIGHPTGNLDELAENVRILRESDIVQVVKTTLQQSTALLPGSKITVCLFALDPDQKSYISLFMHGIYGLAFGPANALIEVVPQGDWRAWLPYTLAHEYNHMIYFQHLCTPQCDPVVLANRDLLDYLISEGWADSFARTLYPNMEAPWVKALTPEQETAQWRGMQEYLTSTSQNDRVRFLLGDNQIPVWTGYTIGFHVVQKYIQSHPNASPLEWIKLGSDQLLAESGYIGQP